jgi:hypothetical protein
VFKLGTAVGSQKSTQALGAPRKIKKCLITQKVTTNFLISLCTPIPSASFSRPTAVFRLNFLKPRKIKGIFLDKGKTGPDRNGHYLETIG